MQYEVELKFRVDSHQVIEQRIGQLGAKLIGSNRQRDQYFRHPCRDFKETDEALRIRQTDSTAFVTYKGPKIDPITKTRHEIDVAVELEACTKFGEMFHQLGFLDVAQVTKTRREFSLVFENREYQIALDVVDRVGTFVEIETIADKDSLSACQQQIQRLAIELGLSDPTRVSYLQFVIEANQD